MREMIFFSGYIVSEFPIINVTKNRVSESHVVTILRVTFAT